LDVHLRAAMEEELARVHAASGATTLYITHDQREAMALATRVAVMQEGRLLQVDAPDTIYERPASEAVARFIGRSTICDAKVERVDGARALVSFAGARFEAYCLPTTQPGRARVMVRPSHVVIDDGGPVAATLIQQSYRGGLFEADLAAQEGLRVAAVARDRLPEERVSIRFSGGWVLPQEADVA
ncbi:MAG: ABC transporter ATP-binding protein, partial [Pseudomonadota bacterium]